MSDLIAKAEAFRQLNLAGKLLLPNAWDAASARLFEEAGFPAIGTTSAGIAYTRGFADAERIGRDTMMGEIANVVRAVEVPVTADVEAGYGDSPEDVETTVRATLEAGAVGVNLEDNQHGNGDSPLYEVDLQRDRIRAARDEAERRGIALTINARTDTFLLGLGENDDDRVELTIQRGRAYLEAGADTVFVPLLVEPGAVARLADAFNGRLSLMAMPGAPDAATLFKAGAARVSIGQTAMLASLGTVKTIAGEMMRFGTWSGIEETFFGFGEAESLHSRQ